MAQTITLLKDFAGGQGAGASVYVTYADDLDLNFSTLETGHNQLVAEVSAVLGQNALLPQDMLQINDPNTPLASTAFQGVIGEHSYEVSINGGDTTQLLVEEGQSLINNRRVSNSGVGQTTLVGSGGSGTRWVALDANGQLSLETAAGQQDLDVASVNWDGAQFTGAVTQLAPIFFDGDEYAQMLERPAAGTGPVFPAKSFRLFATRIGAVERILAGETTDADGDSLGDVELARLLLATAGSAAAAAVDREGDEGNGLFWPFGDAVSLAAGGVEGLRVREGQVTGGVVQVLASATGDVDEPDFSFIGDEDTGIWRPGANRLGFSTAGVQVGEFTAEGFASSATQARAIYRRNAVQSVASGTALVVVTLDVADVRVPAAGWGTPSTATLTVPANAGGRYLVSASAEFEANATGDRRVAVTLNGAGTVFTGGRLQQKAPAPATGTGNLTTSGYVELTAGDVLRLEVAQDSGGNLNVTGSLSLVKLW